MEHTFLIYPTESFWYNENLPMDIITCFLYDIKAFVNILLDYNHIHNYKSYTVKSTDGKYHLEIGVN